MKFRKIFFRGGVASYKCRGLLGLPHIGRTAPTLTVFRKCRFALVCVILLAGCTASVELSEDELAHIPKAQAAAFINENQVNEWCVFGDSQVRLQNGTVVEYSEADVAYHIRTLPRGYFEIDVQVKTPGFGGWNICPIANDDFGGYWVSDKEYVKNMAQAFVSLGFRKGKYLGLF